MNIKMEINKKRAIITICVIFVLVFLRIWFFPTLETMENGKCLCWYRFAVYKCYYVESEGEGDEANVPLFDIFVHKEKKIGGLKEFLLLKEINNEEDDR